MRMELSTPASQYVLFMARDADLNSLCYIKE